MSKIKVTNVEFTEYVKKNLLGFVKIELNDTIIISGFKAMLSKDGKLFIAMPSHYAKDEDRYYSDIYIEDEEDYENFVYEILTFLDEDFDINEIIKKARKKSTAKGKKSTAKGKKSTAKGKKSTAKVIDVDCDEDEDDMPF